MTRSWQAKSTGITLLVAGITSRFGHAGASLWERPRPRTSNVKSGSILIALRADL
ncbi:MAG: hypothetical protein KME26_26495 [Oscillatoria princeps RMCB-10]|nr:hypothetical protein [Oscillatoria princeps RMCB-10]